MSIRIVRNLLVCALIWSGSVHGAAVIMSREAVLLEFTPELGQLYRYSYTLTGAALQRNQEIDIRFDPAYYSRLSNAVAGPGIDVLLLQPNNPPGSPGDFSILVLIDNPSPLAPFTVDALYTGQGAPGQQAFYINQLDDSGRITSVLAGGFTQQPVPEPAGWMLGGLGLTALAIRNAVRRRSRHAAC